MKPLQALLIASFLALLGTASATEVEIKLSAKSVRCHEFIEAVIRVKNPGITNPFTEVQVFGEMAGPGEPALAQVKEGETAHRVEGFCDSADGSLYKVRFMPAKPGRHEVRVTWGNGGPVARTIDTFEALPGTSPGIVRVDPAHPAHFIYDRSGGHFFYNSTTAYWLLGFTDEAVIRESIDRLARLKVNRIRVALNGRNTGGVRWKEEAIVPTKDLQFRLEPWVAARPENIENPGYDVTRFNVDYFRKVERMLLHARKRGMIVSLIFHLDGRDPGVDPFGKAGMGGQDEQRYYRYVIARLSAFPNIMWDVTNEWHLFRDEPWVEKMGALIKKMDPHQHTTSVHGKGVFPFRKSPWADYAMFQSWDEHGAYDFMLRNRREQAATGQPKPQINEEYGYEDHYPYPWGEARRAPARVADNRRRLAWEISMAGGYQTTGERANIAGYGGWITGRGNKEMTMLQGYSHMRAFFESMEWWKLEPAPEMTASPARCLAEPGKRVVIYQPDGAPCTVKLPQGRWKMRTFNPTSGKWSAPKELTGGDWTTPASAVAGADQAVVLETR